MSEEEQCPFCLGPMEAEVRDGCEWRVCPNGCATEYEAPPQKPPMAEDEVETAVLLIRVSGAGS